MSVTTPSARRPSISSVASDAPVPRESNQMPRLNDANPSKKRTNAGSSHMRSIGKKNGLAARIVTGPLPTTWYAIAPIAVDAKRVALIAGPYLSPAATNKGPQERTVPVAAHEATIVHSG
jgi:hypothetical protein